MNLKYLNRQPNSNVMKTIKLCCSLLGIVFVLTLSSCQKIEFPDPSSLPPGLEGTWVETKTISDTIVFLSNDNDGMFYLHRGFEIRDGYRLPTIGSTVYQYEISGDSIKLINGLSSLWGQEVYYFHFDEPNLTIKIGKFSKYIDTKKSILIFRKIK